MSHAFCTLFDIRFAPQGIILLESLARYMPEAKRFVLALDDQVAPLIHRLFNDSVTVIPLAQLEDEALRTAKNNRAWGEYCWTLTPFLPDFVLKRFPELQSVTYVDADVCFFSSPLSMLNELIANQKQVLITEHGYDPKYDQTENCGRFCVQFVTFMNSPGAFQVLNWWKERCLEWCYARFEDGKFGDQKYLDVWPEIFEDTIHIYSKNSNTLAPWNVEWFLKRDHISETNLPVFYHYHGLRLFSDRVCLFDGYYISQKAQSLFYAPYLRQLSQFIHRIGGHDLFEIKNWHTTFRNQLRLWVRKSQGRVKFVPTGGIFD